jgi:glycosyltransferase involved in cell wall biosynthesis
MYFVQDFEPAFAPMGSEYVLAENTYRLGLYHVTSGRWCERILRSQFGAAADHFRFPIDKHIYFPRPRTVQNKRLVFFAKPEMPRRCFELGALALRQVKNMRPDVEIVMFGSEHAAKQHLDFPVTFVKVVPTLDGLAEMYSNADAGMVFSTTNPSLVPYEMMACGLPVIDLDRSGNEINYDDRRDIALLANPLPDVMARQVVELLDSDGQRQMRSCNGLALAADFPNEEQMARRIESLIINRLRNKACPPSPLRESVVIE